MENMKMMLEIERLKNHEEVDKLAKMKDLGVDLTTMLVAQCHNPDKLYRFDGAPGMTDVKLHLHEGKVDL